MVLGPEVRRRSRPHHGIPHGLSSLHAREERLRRSYRSGTGHQQEPRYRQRPVQSEGRAGNT